MGRRRLASSLWFAALVSASLTAAFQARATRAATFRRVAKLSDEVEDAVEKGGVEGGLFSIFKSDGDGESKGADAKALLAYGAAYLATSISLALVSFSICYLLIDSGADAAAGWPGRHRRDGGDGEGHDHRHRLRGPQGREPHPLSADRR
ncbi:hypothetical protein JL720_15798 [Aureococcus anophagefferens]|nr:hypothetical protein JL720_15798 [Aureococcus anophagefferens]